MRVAVIALLTFGLLASTPGVSIAQQAEALRFGQVDGHRLATADSEPGQWFTPGRDVGESYFSPLVQIDRKSVQDLGFAWQYPLETARGLEASPIVVDGVMFAVGNYGRVYALNAATGVLLWRFSPRVDMRYAQHACCDVVNRGLAIWKGRVYVGAIDGYLYSLDARTGKVIWKSDTFAHRDGELPYSMTGAPTVTRDAVVIGNSGADFAGVRGYVSAFDLATGKLKWRFFTVPRDPALGPQDQPHLSSAVKTWTVREPWQAGGGTVWDGLIYDPDTDLVFFGTGNVAPYDRAEGREKGDELYACSVIGVHAETGQLAWFYQEVPGDRWDLDATQKLILTTLRMRGKVRRVLMQAGKDGFFYVFDRQTGQVLAANNFTFVNWTKGLDPKSYRPIMNPAADYHGNPAVIWPSAFGAHSWQPMSFDPATRLVYIPAMEMPNIMISLVSRPAKYSDTWFATQGFYPNDYDPKDTIRLYGRLPSLKTLERRYRGPIAPRGSLIAWDPVHERVVWRAPSPTLWDGGVMSTAGGLVFHGEATGVLDVYDAETGALLRAIAVGTSIMAAPVAYRVGGEEYIAFMAGFGGSGGFAFDPDTAAYRYGNAGRIVALRLGGGPVPIPPRVVRPPVPRPGARPGRPGQVRRGEILYTRVCSRCHVFGPGLVPDLRSMSPAIYRLFPDIVRGGLLMPEGMGNFSSEVSPEGAADIRAYIMSEAWKAYEGQAEAHAEQAH